ncbi:unnamed protein product, partial [Prorocentrum cordatum]
FFGGEGCEGSDTRVSDDEDCEGGGNQSHGGEGREGDGNQSSCGEVRESTDTWSVGDEDCEGLGDQGYGGEGHLCFCNRSFGEDSGVPDGQSGGEGCEGDANQTYGGKGCEGDGARSCGEKDTESFGENLEGYGGEDGEGFAQSLGEGREGVDEVCEAKAAQGNDLKVGVPARPESEEKAGGSASRPSTEEIQQMFRSCNWGALAGA